MERFEYTPYGSLAFASSPEPRASSAFKFTGQRLDASTGLYFFNARYYDPTLGRFISPDPTVQAPGDPQSLNRYAYARNNPVNLVDPTGYEFSWRKLFGWVSTALSILIPPLAPALMLANLGLGLADAIQTGNWVGFAGSVVGSYGGAQIFGAMGQQVAQGFISGMLGTGAGSLAGSFLGGAIAGAVEFGLAGFGAGFGGALGGGASFSEAVQAGAMSAAVSGAIGAGIQGSYLGGLQNTLHGNSYERIAAGQGYAPLASPNPGLGAAASAATRTRQSGGKIHPAILQLNPNRVFINRSTNLTTPEAAALLRKNNMTTSNIWAELSIDALESARLAGNLSPTAPEIHGGGRPGYYWHYHPRDNALSTKEDFRLDSHAWYGLPTQ